MKIHADIAEIGDYAFCGCESLVSVVFGGAVAQWEAVKGKIWLLLYTPAKVVKCADGKWQKSKVLVENGVAVKYLDKNAASVEIPEGVTSIGRSVSYGCRSLTSVVIPSSIVEIGEGGFGSCNLLESVKFGGTVAQWEAVKGKLNLFQDIPAESVKCADGEWQKPVLLVENGVAVKCFDTSITSVEIPVGVTEIGENAFESCWSLASVVISAGVTKIGECSFGQCRALASVVIPASVTHIEKEVFFECSSLETIEFCGTVAQWEAIEKGDGWKYGVPAKAVKCADGEVKL